MPRRLGDDPLSRKRSPSAKDVPSAQPGHPAQRTSHNDVFFLRRTENPQPKLEGVPDKQLSLGETKNVEERPEISEVVEIVRTAQVAKSTQGAEELVGPLAVDEAAHPPVEEPVVRLEQARPTAIEPVAAIEPSSSVDAEPAVAPSSQSETRPQKSEGFLKRLFGRFGK